VGSSNDEPTPTATRPSYLDAARKALWATSPPSAGAANATQCVAAMEGALRVPARGKRCQRRRSCAPAGRGAPPPQSKRVSAQRRLGQQQAARVPMHQLLGEGHRCLTCLDSLVVDPSSTPMVSKLSRVVAANAGPGTRHPNATVQSRRSLWVTASTASRTTKSPLNVALHCVASVVGYRPSTKGVQAEPFAGVQTWPFTAVQALGVKGAVPRWGCQGAPPFWL
jgi:hypothetical protein